jgi:hypothetical protein
MIDDELLRKNVDLRVKRVTQKPSLFNIFIYFGPTRSGKSTLARQIAYHMSVATGITIEWSKCIHFDVDEMYNEASKPENEFKHYILDEASFQLMSADRSTKFQLMLQKFYNTAAKYHQTHHLIMPNLQQFKKDFLLDFHTCGFETTIRYNKRTGQYVIGLGRAHSRISLATLYDKWKKNNFVDAINYRGGGFSFTFKGKEEYWTSADLALYEQRKDKAIQTMIKKAEKEKPQKEMVEYGTELFDTVRTRQKNNRVRTSDSDVGNIFDED